jgi:hypothetical protein
MANKDSKYEPISIFGNISNNGVVEEDSRLSRISNNLRNTLQTRNLYTPNVEYPNNSTNTASKIVNAVDSLIGIVAPFKSFSLKNNYFARITNPTPLTEIGTVMLAKQMAYNSSSHISQQNLPTLNLSNLFDGNKDTKLFEKNINLKITKKEDTTFQDKFNNFIDKIVFDGNTTSDSPFSKSSTNADYIRNTGDGQLNFLYQSINNNLYKQDDSTLIEFGLKIKKPLQPRKNMVNTQSGGIVTSNSYKPFFNFSNIAKNPYLNISTTFFAEVIANKAMANSYLVSNEIQEYAPTRDFIKTYFGKTLLAEPISLNDGLSNSWIDENVEFKNDLIGNKLVWGRDGISTEANTNIDPLRGDKDQVDNDYSDQINDPTIREFNYNKFNIKSGLLEYTRNLINATNGNVGDLTRKAFNEGDGKYGFNGSGLWKSNNSIYAQKAEIAGKKGVRQHSQLDQYDRFTKAIRFNGSEVYNGNVDSVTYKTVIPRIHPTLPLTNGVPNNKNLMFSIENLAVGVISKGTKGIIDDEFGSEIPICEVGPFYGRIMWFPPYGLELNEVASAKYESTVMVGRNEPMYNYQNSERTATLSFIMLMDYPSHLKQFHNTQNKQKEMAEFFAFGGDPYTPKKPPVNNPEEKIKQLQNEIEKIVNKPDVEDPNTAKPNPIKVVFPNDVPFVSDNLNTIIDKMYTKYRYEIIDGLPSNGTYGDVSSFGYNRFIYVANDDTGVKAGGTFGKYYLDSGVTSQVGFTQYTQTGDCDLNKILKDFYSNESNRQLYNISVFGGASKLYTEKNKFDIKEEEDYNKSLGLRRAKAVITFIKRRLAAIFEKDFDDLGINVILGGGTGGGTVGSQFSSQTNATEVAIPLASTKLERFALIEITRNENTTSSKQKKLTQEETEIIRKKQEEIQELEKDLVKGNEAYDCVYNEKNSKNGILHGFQAISGNYFSPVFHSQTPEDFHRRLTFLQQCVRQGAAKRYNVVEENGLMRAKNSVFGRQPVCILRLGDFFYTKVVIDNVTFDYTDAPWDTNSENFGTQFMFAKITIQMKVIGGQSLKGPIDALQNAVSFNYYANSTFSRQGMYKLPSDVADNQEAYINGILVEKYKDLSNAFDNNVNKIK